MKANMEEKIFNPYIRASVPLFFGITYSLSVNFTTDYFKDGKVLNVIISFAIIVISAIIHIMYEVRASRILARQLIIAGEDSWVNNHLISLSPGLKMRHDSLINSGNLAKVLKETADFHKAFGGQ